MLQSKIFVAVCVTFLGKFYKLLQEDKVEMNSDNVEKALLKSCSAAKGKENRFVSPHTNVTSSLPVPLLPSNEETCGVCACAQCYYIGATSDAATKMTNEVSKPLSYHAPVDKICEKLKKKDSQICELRYGN